MVIPKILRCASLLLMVSVLVPASGQEKRPAMPSSPQDLLIRLLSARESMVQYAVELNISEKKRKMGDKDWIAPPQLQNIQMYIEFSKLDDHLIFAVQKSPRYPSFDGWVISGRSKDIFFRGTPQSLTVASYDPALHHPDTMVAFVEVTQIGFLVCTNWLNSIKYTLKDVLAPKIERCESEPDYYKIQRLDDGVIELSHRHPYWTSIYQIDPARDYWVVYSENWQDFSKSGRSVETDFSVKTTVSLEKRHDMYVPNLVQMFCEKPSQKSETYYHVTLDWESINQPISTGRECAPRLLERLGRNGTVK